MWAFNDAENHLVVASGGSEQVNYNYVYDGNGAMVIESAGVITTVYIANYYEYVISGTETITRSYYGVYAEPGRSAGSQRVAMREEGGRSLR